jgi:diguanylate cyclase (GGDEF)-like protein
MRILGGLGLLAPVGLVVLVFLDPHAMDAWFEHGTRSLIAAVVAGVIGVSLTSLVVFGFVRLRFARLIKAAERIAGGEVGVTVKVRTGGLEARLGQAINGISSAIAATQEAATVDKLTGVANRQSLLAALFNEVERSSRYNRPLSVAFVDIDHFKAVNDTHGHAVGDVVLRGVAQAIKTNLRGTDIIGRYGGEEFMLLLAETEVEDGAMLTEKLRDLVQRLRFAARC